MNSQKIRIQIRITPDFHARDHRGFYMLSLENGSPSLSRKWFTIFFSFFTFVTRACARCTVRTLTFFNVTTDAFGDQNERTVDAFYNDYPFVIL